MIACLTVEHHKRLATLVAPIIIAIIDDHRMICIEPLRRTQLDIIFKIRLKSNAVTHAVPIRIAHQQKGRAIAIFKSVRPRLAHPYETAPIRIDHLEGAGSFEFTIIAFNPIIPRAAFDRRKPHAPNLPTVPKSREPHFLSARRGKNASDVHFEIRIAMLLRRGEPQLKRRVYRHTALRTHCSEWHR